MKRLMSARTPSHGGVLVAREQGGEAADVVAVFLHGLLVDGLAFRALGIRPRGPRNAP